MATTVATLYSAEAVVYILVLGQAEVAEQVQVCLIDYVSKLCYSMNVKMGYFLQASLLLMEYILF